MKVRAAMLNGHGICHGGLIFTLADSTFAFACNSHNKVTVAAGCSIEFLKPAQLATCSPAKAIEQVLQGRPHGIYDMKVTNQRGDASPCSAARAPASRARSIAAADEPERRSTATKTSGD